jgi:hypothetical protein
MSQIPEWWELAGDAGGGLCSAQPRSLTIGSRFEIPAKSGFTIEVIDGHDEDLFVQTSVKPSEKAQ